MNFKAVVFDMDGLMLDSEKAFQYAWQKTATDFGYVLDDTIYFRLIGLGSNETNSLLFREFGDDFPLVEFRAHYPTHWTAYTQQYGIATKPGVHELLDCLDRLGLPRAVATSTSEPKAIPQLKKANLYDRFQAFVYGNEIANGKPAPDIYLEAALRLGIAPQNCLALEDSEAGTRSATSAGMQAIIVPDMKHPAEDVAALALAVVPSLLDVIALLES